MKRILVLLSTYNGSLYLKEQIDSILSQKGVCITLLIRDDGSRDATRSILSLYEKAYANIYVRYEENVGCCQSFYHLAEIANETYTDYDYFAFADQDDVWDEDKLLTAVQYTAHIDSDKPFLYGSNYRLVDSNNHLIGVPKKALMTLGGSLFSNNVIGCTMVFNHRMLNFFLMARPEHMYLHDCWMIRTCFAIGAEFVFNPNPTMSYRQHGNNVIGGSRSWLTRFMGLFYGYDYDIIKANAYVRIIYSKYLTKESAEMLDLICSYKKSLSIKNKIIFHSAIKSGSLLSNLKLYIYLFINPLRESSFGEIIKNNRLVYNVYVKIRDYKINRALKPYINQLEKLFDKETSVITTNCFGGRLAQSLHIAYNSPTAGLYFMYPDYIAFLKNLPYYLTDAKITFVNQSKYELGNKRLLGRTMNGQWYPIGLLDGKIEIHFLHYHSTDEAADKWYRRSARVDFNKLLILGFEQNLCTINDIREFDALPYKHKYMFSTKQVGYSSNVFVSEFASQEEVGNPYLDAPVFYKYLINKLKTDIVYESSNRDQSSY